MPTIEFDGKIVNVDKNGFLNKFENWNKNWPEHVKGECGIEELTDDHWKVIEANQEYYKRNGVAPMVRVLGMKTGFKLKYLYDLFPKGPMKDSAKMAGLPKPAPNCIS